MVFGCSTSSYSRYAKLFVKTVQAGSLSTFNLNALAINNPKEKYVKGEERKELFPRQLNSEKGCIS